MRKAFSSGAIDQQRLTLSTSIASRAQRVVDDRDTPLSIGARDARISKSVLPDGETEKFFREGLDFLDFAEKRIAVLPVGQITAQVH